MKWRYYTNAIPALVWLIELCALCIKHAPYRIAMAISIVLLGIVFTAAKVYALFKL